jgi:hypothetical protein
MVISMYMERRSMGQQNTADIHIKLHYHEIALLCEFNHHILGLKIIKTLYMVVI